MITTSCRWNPSLRNNANDLPGGPPKLAGQDEKGDKEKYISEDDNSSDVETLKAEVLKSIASALESKAGNPTGVLDFDHERGVDFYEEVIKFEIELIKHSAHP